jgi:serine protease Do
MPRLPALAIVFCLCACQGRAVRGHQASASPKGASLPVVVFPAATRSQAQVTSVTPRLEPAPEAQALSSSFEAVAKAIRPSVVRIDVEGLQTPASDDTADLPDFLKRFLGDQGRGAPAPRRMVHGTGSGVLVDDKADILTSSHVVRGFQKVTVMLPDQRTFPARVVGTDPLTDVGVVRLEKPPAGLVAARLGDSDKLRIGEWALAVGSPLGLDQTVTVGIISGIGETGARFRFESGERVRRYIQTDAKINPGNSGGPLVNLEGEVVGLNTLINVGPGGSYGFAIPINQAWQVAGILIKEGHVRYPYIGVNVIGVTPEVKDALAREGKKVPDKGVVVAGLTANGPAAQAGLTVGDAITAVDGHPIASPEDLVAAISAHAIGSSATVDVWRTGHVQPTQVKVQEYPSEEGTPGQQPQLGIALQTLTPDVAQSLGIEPRTKGAVITEVVPGSTADKAGLAAGDVIREVDRKPVTSAEEAVAALRAGKGTRLLRITNAAGTRFVSIAPG